MAYTGDQTPGFIKGGATAVTGKGSMSGMYTSVGGTTPTAKKTVGQSKLGDLIAKMLLKISQDTSGAYTAKQQLAAQTAFFESGIRTLDVTPKAAWDKIKHPGVSDYYWGEMKNMVASGRTDPVQGAKSMLGLQAEWARRAERSPYMTYPSGGVAAGKAHIAPYLEAGGLVSSYEYIANNPEYADYLYQQDPVYADSILYSFVDPYGGLKYGGIDENVRTLWQEAADNMQVARARYAKQYPQFPWMAWQEHERGQETYPWMWGRPSEGILPSGIKPAIMRAAPPKSTIPLPPMETLPPWAQPVGPGTTVPRW